MPTECSDSEVNVQQALIITKVKPSSAKATGLKKQPIRVKFNEPAADRILL